MIEILAFSLAGLGLLAVVIGFSALARRVRSSDDRRE